MIKRTVFMVVAVCLYASSALGFQHGILSASGGSYQGVSWDQSADTYSRRGSIVSDTIGTSPGNAKLPIHRLIRRCLLSDEGAVNYYLCATDSTLKADCSTAANIDGTDGQVMVEIPKFYYKYSKVGNVYAWDISLSKLSGFTVHPAFIKAGVEVPYRYIGAYEGSMYDATAGAMVAAADVVSNMYTAGDKLCSVSGVYPKMNETRAEFRTMATARGTGWHQLDAYLVSAIQLLYLVEYADFDSQATIGNGRVSLTAGDWVASEIHDGTNYGYIGKCGLSDSIGNATGADSSATNLTIGESPAYMSYRGIENFWGNVWKFFEANVHNSTEDRSRMYVSGNYTAFADDTSTGYSLVGLLAEVDEYATNIIDSGTGFWPSAASGGGSATFLADYYYTYFNDNSDVGWRMCLFGGNALSGSYAGAFCVYSYSGSSFSLASLGGRLVR